MKLSKAGKEELALALILLKDFKSQEQKKVLDVKLILMIKELAAYVGVEKEYDELLSKVPPMLIKPRE